MRAIETASVSCYYGARSYTVQPVLGTFSRPAFADTPLHGRRAGFPLEEWNRTKRKKKKKRIRQTAPTSRRTRRRMDSQQAQAAAR